MNRVVAALSGALLALVAFDASLWRAAHAARTHNAALLERVAALESSRTAPSPQSAALEVGRPASPQALAQLPAPRPAGNDASAADATPFAAGIRQAMDTPEGREFTRTMLRMSLEQEHPDLVQQLGITQEQADQLLELLARYRVDIGADRVNLTAGAPDPAAREQRARVLAEKEQAHEAEVAGLLGASYDKWKDYERGANQRLRESYERQGREQMREAVDGRGNPLGEARFNAFAAAVDAEQKRIEREAGGQSLQQQVQRLPENNRRLLDVAAGHLDPDQLERYRRHLEQQAEMMRITLRTMDPDGA